MKLRLRTPASEDPGARMSEMRTAVIGALVVMLGPISMSLYTPAMPAMVHAFDTTPAAIKLTLTVYFIGFALAQLVCGPMSDAYGRRPVGIGFFTIYLAGSVIAAAAPSLSWLLAGRILQGIGAAAGISMSRAMVRDQYSGQQAARILNLIGVMLAIGPAVSPTLGGVILSTIGWQAIFFVMVLYGSVAIWLIAFVAPETNRNRDRALARPSAVLASYRTLFANRTFVATSLLIAMSPGGLYTLAAILPFVMIEKVGLTPTQFGMGMLAQTGSFMTGAALAGVLLRRTDATRLVPVGLALVALSGLGFCIGLRIWPPSFISVMAPTALWAFGNAFIMPGATTAALAPFPRIAGAASAVTGFMQIGGGLAGTAVAALLFHEPFNSLRVIMPVMSVIAIGSYAWLVWRGGGLVTTTPTGEPARRPDPAGGRDALPPSGTADDGHHDDAHDGHARKTRR
ncbi:multidrug effflux MFS transporter [Camelimonas lactis]|uniref:Bcr/CflA family efflux transporter n=1 Tax=Camelimonas lactis TaxID=659006 RepID=A0A4R2GXH5_9HYPH|nr:multidrug effflux MFS transporter [Camelimonas lactis]TCO15930.1 DHA1 family bicyclomycin/chloramphenicol resistance-like MFS transporter [Camelimonas lactis]